MEVGDPREVRYNLAGHPTYHVNVTKLKRRDYNMDRRVTSPNWGSPAPCKQALSYSEVENYFNEF